MSRVQIHPELLSWAADQAGLDLDRFTQKLSTRDADKIKTGSLSEAQARKAAQIAKAMGVPVVNLYYLLNLHAEKCLNFKT